MSKTKTSSSGVGFMGLLTLIFIALKLTDHIAWSWWWVLAPIWLPWALLTVGLFVYGVWLVIERESGKS